MRIIMNKFSAIFFISAVAFLFSSCASSISIPGEKNRVVENLAAEYYNIADAYLDQKNYKTGQ